MIFWSIYRYIAVILIIIPYAWPWRGMVMWLVNYWRIPISNAKRFR